MEFGSHAIKVVDGYAVQAEFYKALAHPVRLRILEILAVEESCVCHLTAVLKQRQPYVSQHLMTLRAAELVAGRRDGVIVYYRLTVPNITEVLRLGRLVLSEGCREIAVKEVPRYPVTGCPCPKCDRGD